MSKLMIVCALAGVAGCALVAADAAAPVRRAPAAHPQPARFAHTQQRFHNAGVRQHSAKIVHTQQRFHNVRTQQHNNKTANTQQRLHRVATTHQGTSNPKINPKNLTHFQPGSQPGAKPLIAHGALKLGPAKVGPVAHKPSTLHPTIKLGNKVAPIWKVGHKQIWFGNRWRIFVAFTAIPVVRYGGGYFWPDAYVSVGRPYCTGSTLDGCRLNWQPVNFEDGGSAFQCVQFCPRPNVPPPPQSVALVSPPPVPMTGACEVSVYSEPNFAGQDATTGEEQPALSQSGWQNQIVSIQVKSGTWDFFSEENFAGNNMRLEPGPYQDLGPEWSKKINSFMCVTAAAPGATATAQPQPQERQPQQPK